MKTQMLIEQLFKDIGSAFDSDKCFEVLCKIHETDRFFRFRSFRQTAQTCLEVMRQAGLSDIRSTPLSADGATPYGDWVIPQAWDAENATLTAQIDGKSIVLADYNACPCSLSMYSAPTPSEGIKTEIVQIGKTSEFEGVDVRGKIIFTDRPAADLVDFAVKGGATGIVTDFIQTYKGIRESREELRGVTRWDNSFVYPKNETGLFAFNLTPENGDLLRERLSAGERIAVHASVDSCFYDGVCETVSGAILGSGPDAGEIVLYGHLYEPGAHDNTSGCAVMLELARALNAMINGGIIPRPKHTIRFVFGFECTGSLGFLQENPDIAQKTLCSIVADMIGTEKNDRCSNTLWHNPYSNYSYMDSGFTEVNRLYSEIVDSTYKFNEHKFSALTDNIIGDPIYHMPTVAMLAWPALSYHSSMDTPDRIELPVLKRNGIIIGTLAFTAACAGEGERDWLSSVLKKDMRRLLGDESNTPLRRYMLKTSFEQASESIDALFGRQPANAQLLEGLDLASIEIPFTPPTEEVERTARVPVRMIKGCLTFAPHPDLAGSKWQPAWNTSLMLPLFWADGKRTLWEISVLYAAETGAKTAEEVTAQYLRIAEFIDFLTVNGYARYK